MNRITFALVVTLVVLCSGQAIAQGSVQAVRGAADAIKGKVNDSQQPLTAGPADPQERVKPGKIDDGASRQFKTTADGLKYRILRKGTGNKPKASDTVEVHYKGWLDNKEIFDSSYRRAETISFPLSRVVKGWTLGMQLVKEGGMIELDIPYTLGYGARGSGPIPPKATLHFIVELIKVK